MSEEEHTIPAPENATAINYIEINVTNIPACKAFYGEAFNWNFMDYGDAYCAFHHGEGYGGFNLVNEAMRGGALIVLFTTDLEASLEKVKAAGGEITLDIFSFPGGRRFQFLDPSGNELGVWSQ